MLLVFGGIEDHKESMMESVNYILQYEFFHVGGKKDGSIDDVIGECLERINDNLAFGLSSDDFGTGIKTVVRIYDAEGQVTGWAKQVKYLEERREVHLNAKRSNLITNWYARWQIGRLNREIAEYQKSIVNYLISYIDLSFKDNRPVGIEIWNHSFRLARREEYIELRQVVIRAKGLWMFIFKPNDLLSVNNEGVVSIM